ncbi:ABC transporter permease [Streptomyces sp. S465]|uniref:ABC transporter permease n=1 Tax=Streptomyces sp. S465 TaxID=2979468 RepID=UPI0022A898C6|nr:ABC transporter permease [Streptomyces sp. S465]WAP59543.1 ABC transporter permease [Streptomyces sp. S465]
MARTEASPESRLEASWDGPPAGFGGLAGDLRAVRVMWQRELIRLSRNRIGSVMSLLTPLLFLLVLGTGMNSVTARAGADGTDYRTYLLPGAVLMVVMAPALNTGMSIVWDRHAGFLREMLVAPVHRTALISGICLGGATAATAHGVLLLMTAALFGATFAPLLLVPLVMELLAITLAFTALGALAAVSVERMETFQSVVGIAMTPLIFLSGAFFPSNGLPGWLQGAVLANPLSYATDAMRQTLATDGSGNTGAGLHWAGWQVPVMLEVAALSLLALTALAAAARRFSRTD